MAMSPGRIARALERRVAAGRLWPLYRRILAVGWTPRLVGRVAERSARRAGRLDEALLVLESVAERRPLDARVRESLGQLLAESGRSAEASELYRAAATLAPTHVAAWRGLVDACLKLKDTEGAWEGMRHLRVLAPGDAFVHDRTAAIRRAWGQRREEAEALQAWLTLEPGSQLARLRLAESLTALHRFQEAQAALKSLGKSWSRRPAAQRLTAQLEVALGERGPRDMAEAISLGRPAEAAALAPSRLESAQGYLSAGLFEEALAALGEMQGTEPEWIRGRVADLRGDFSTAARHYDALAGEPGTGAVDLDGFEDADYARGRAWLAAGDTGRALVALRAWDARTVADVALPTPAEGAERSSAAHHLGLASRAGIPAAERARHLQSARAKLGRASRSLVRATALAWQEAGEPTEEARVWLEAVRLRTPSAVSRSQLLTSESKLRRALYAEAQRRPLAERTILFQSSRASRAHCNPLALFRQIATDDRFLGWDLVWAANNVDNVPADVRADGRVRFVRFNSSDYVETLATAGWLINNVTFPDYFNRRPGQRYLNTWHGTPLKALGRFATDTFLSYANVARNVLQSTHLAMPNEHTARAMEWGMGLEGVVPGRIMITGSPRLDETLNVGADKRAALKQRLGIDDDRPVVLFAPTWKGSLGNVTAPAGLVDELAAMAGPSHHLLFRAHRLAERSIGGLTLPAQTVPGDIDTNELLAIVDVLITDYSSICFDFLPLNRPVIFHVPDFEDYLKDRGLQLAPEDWPGVVCRSLEETAGAVTRAVAGHQSETELSRHRAAHARFCSQEDGQASARTVEAFFFDGAAVDFSSARALSRIEARLVRAGHPVEAALATQPTEHAHVVPLLEKSYFDRDREAGQEFIDRVGDGAHVLLSPGSAMTADERYADALLRRPTASLSAWLLERVRDADEREARRLFGGLRAHVWGNHRPDPDGLARLVEAAQARMERSDVEGDVVLEPSQP